MRWQIALAALALVACDAEEGGTSCAVVESQIAERSQAVTRASPEDPHAYNVLVDAHNELLAEAQDAGCALRLSPMTPLIEE